MRAPSSEVEAKEIGAEVEKRPNVQAVFAALLAHADTLPSGEKRESILRAAACLDVGLRPGEDISDAEREDWLRQVAARS